MEKITCAVLAGGKAERLPGKPFLLLNGKPLISHVIDAACEYFGEILVIVKSQEQKNKIEKITSLKIKLLSDNSDDFSPWSGVRAALENAKADWIFLIACDMPFANKELFRLLVSKIGPGVDCIVPRTDRLQPLCALYRNSVLEKASMEGSITRFAESLKKEVVQISERNAFWLFNINTKEDIGRAKWVMKNKTA